MPVEVRAEYCGRYMSSTLAAGWVKTPGVFTHPAASVEDMYRPQYSARTATGMMEVKAP